MKTTGILYLVPTLLSEDNPGILPGSVLTILHSLDEFIVENEKSARHFLKMSGHPAPQSAFKFHLLNEHTDPKDISNLLEPLKSGRNVGLMSEAGCPGIADPGSEVVRLAHAAGIRIRPLTGPSSILLSLMGSGLNGQQFLFHGYLPREQAARKTKIRDIEKDMIRKNQTQIFIEVPYRNEKLISDILAVCLPETKLCIACNLTANNEFIQTRSIHDWTNKIPVIQKKPCIFLLGN